MTKFRTLIMEQHDRLKDANDGGSLAKSEAIKQQAQWLKDILTAHDEELSVLEERLSQLSNRQEALMIVTGFAICSAVILLMSLVLLMSRHPAHEPRRNQ